MGLEQIGMMASIDHVLYNSMTLNVCQGYAFLPAVTGQYIKIASCKSKTCFIDEKEVLAPRKGETFFLI